MTSDTRYFRVLPIPYYAADTIVAQALDKTGQDIGVLRRWTQTSGGSSYHRLADAKIEVLGAHVFALNANDTAVSLSLGHPLQGNEQGQLFGDLVLSEIERRVRAFQHIDPKLRMDLSADDTASEPIVLQEIFQQPVRGPINIDTWGKMEELRDLRKTKKPHRLNWTKACHRVGIQPRTAARHDPKLKEHWDDDDEF